MPWISVPWRDQRVKDVAKEFKVKGVPRLIVLSVEGKVIDDNAVEKVKSFGPQAIEEYLSKV